IRRPGAQEGRGQIGVEDETPLVEGQVVDRLSDVGARVVDEDVQASEPLHGGLRHRIHRRLTRDVDIDGDRRPAVPLDLGRGRARLLSIPGPAEDLGPRRGQPTRPPEADAAVTTRDHRYLVFQVEHWRLRVYKEGCKSFTAARQFEDFSRISRRGRVRTRRAGDVVPRTTTVPPGLT